MSAFIPLLDETRVREIVREELAAKRGTSETNMLPRIAANRAVMDWIDADSGRGLVGCTPSMVAQIAIDAFLAAGGAS